MTDLMLLQAVMGKLREKYSAIPVYLQEVKEGFTPPAFFLKYMTVATPNGLTHRDTDIYITYIPTKKEKTAAILTVLGEVEQIFANGFTVHDRHIAVSSITEELIGQDNDGGRVTMTVEYYDAEDAQQEDAELMRILHYRGKGNAYEDAKH